MANVTQTLIANITATEDTTSLVPVNRSSTISLDGIGLDYTTYQQVGNVSPLVLTIPNTYAYNWAIKNLSSAASLLVLGQLVYSGGAGGYVALAFLSPGGIYICWNTTNAATAITYNGITYNSGLYAIELIASAANTPVEVVFGF